MPEVVLFPRLDSVTAMEKRRTLLGVNPSEVDFRESDLSDLLADPHVFPPTGGRTIKEDELNQFRARCSQAIADASNLSVPEFNRVVDLELGRLLCELGQNSKGEFGQPQVWDFLTLVLLPDVAIRRISSADSSEEKSGSSVDKLTGGSRRHVLQRLWKRWSVFGVEVVCSERLTEDDYGGMLERRLTLERHNVAIKAAESIVSSGYAGQARRRYARALLRNLIALSGVVDISDSDQGNLNDVFDYLRSQTLEMM